MNAIISAGALVAVEGPNNAWLPADPNKVIWGTLAFIVVAVLLYRFGRRPVVDGLKDRSERVRSSLGEAAEAREAAEAERDRIKEALADSDAEAARIIEEARQAADRLRADIAARTEADIAAVRERAEIELAATRAQFETELERELSRLTLGATEAVVETSLDDAAQQRLIDDYIGSVGTQN